MKTIHFLFPTAFFALLLLAQPLLAQSDEVAETGFAGDHFSLEAALELFKKSSSLEEFEELLNTESEGVNNLDLNEDGEIDYIRVEDNVDGDVHAVVLQVPVSEEESQDIAVIEIEKTGAESAILQILGDEDIYGETTIVEPVGEEVEASGKGGPSADYQFNYVVVNVFAWPCVRFVYTPGYRPWRSPFRWRTYPRWWRPWRPAPFRTYRTRVVVYQPRYRVVRTHRVVRAHRVYTPRRRSSTVVRTRTASVRTTKTAVKKTPNGAVVGKKKTTVTPAGKKTTTTKAGVKKTPNGAVAGKKKTTVSKNGRTTKTTKAGVKKTPNGAVGKKKTTTVKRKRKKN